MGGSVVAAMWRLAYQQIWLGLAKKSSVAIINENWKYNLIFFVQNTFAVEFWNKLRQKTIIWINAHQLVSKRPTSEANQTIVWMELLAGVVCGFVVCWRGEYWLTIWFICVVMWSVNESESDCKIVRLTWPDLQKKIWTVRLDLRIPFIWISS